MGVVTLKNPPYSGYCFINNSESIPPEAVAVLDEVMSDYVKNYDMTDKFQSGEWDGKIHLFKRARNGAYYFPVGLTEEVSIILNTFGIDTVVPPRSVETLDLEWVSPLQPREYQNEILRVLMRRNGSGTVEIPTGAGKTLIALRYAYLRKCPFLVVVHRKELLTQWKDEIEATFGITPSLVGDGERDISGDIVVAMVQTLHNILNVGRPRLSFPLIIFDEAHTTPARTAFSVATKIGARWRLGLSATARRTDGLDKMIWGATGPVIGSISVETLVSQGYLAKPVFWLLQTPMSGIHFKRAETYHNVYKRGVVMNRLRNDLIAKCAINGLESNRLIFISVKQILHGEELERLIPGSIFVHAGSPGRTEAIEAFKRGEGPRCMISTLLREGVNVPAADMFINAAGGQSFISTIQSAGRTLRAAPGKHDTILVDFSDDGHRFLINDTRHRFEAYSEVYGNFFEDAEVVEFASG
jgi:superfamily II DNA or RNA helicase